MTARPFASGTISFGLVTIPVKLYSTGESASGIQLNMLHRKCGTRLKQQYICPTDNEVVGREDMVKGYEYAKGQYVLFTEEELKALTPEATNAIEIAPADPQVIYVPQYETEVVYVDRPVVVYRDPPVRFRKTVPDAWLQRDYLPRFERVGIDVALSARGAAVNALLYVDRRMFRPAVVVASLDEQRLRSGGAGALPGRVLRR